MKVLSGNRRRIARLWVRVASAYPGTPSTEILEKLAGCEGIYAEWAPNEKVALDTGIGAAYTGVKALVAMKHVGLNVAADALFYAAYTGVPGGLVIVVADDPGMHSSQNEQDSRHYARFTKLPMLEPSNSQEAYEFVRLAFEISQQFECPVLIRTTTRVAHSKSMVEVGEYENGPHPQRPLRDGEGAFSPPPVGEGLGAGSAPSPTFGHVKGNPAQYVMVPANAKQRHVVVEQRLKQLEEYAESLDANAIELGDKRLGIITSSIAYNYAREVFPQASFLKLGMSYPLPSRKIKEFAASVDMLIVIEELDPFFEEQVRLLGLEVEGKSFIPLLDELSVDVIRAGAVKAGLVPEPAETQKPCPRTTFRSDRRYSARAVASWRLLRAEQAEDGCDVDIGCYTVAVAPPLSAIHTTGCMGVGIGVLHGASKAGAEEPAVVVIGDSTFLHSGIALCSTSCTTRVRR